MCCDCHASIMFCTAYQQVVPDRNYQHANTTAIQNCMLFSLMHKLGCFWVVGDSKLTAGVASS